MVQVILLSSRSVVKFLLPVFLVLTLLNLARYPERNQTEERRSNYQQNDLGPLRYAFDNYNYDWGLENAKPDTCQSVIHKPEEKDIQWRNDHWQLLQDGSNELLASIAFFDERPSVGFLPWIRIHNIGHFARPIFCHVWYESTESPYIVEAMFNKTGRNYSINKTSYGQSMLSCRLATSYPVPSRVSLVVGNKCANGSMLLPVHYTPRSKWKHEFGICVAIAFGSIPATVFAEWAEFQRMFGIGEINVYDAGMTNMSTVFDYYKHQGLLRVFPMPPAVNVHSYDAVKLNSPASLNECMMRHVYRYRFILFIDFDEFLVPRLHSDYSSLLSAVMRQAGHTEPHHTYSARNTYFFRDFEADSSQPSYMRTAQFRNRVPPSKAGYAPKSFIDPRRCFSVFNHYCYLRFPQSGAAWHDMDTNLVLSHHYRMCGFGKDKCETLFKDKIPDDISLTFKWKLKDKLDKALMEMGIQSL